MINIIKPMRYDTCMSCGKTIPYLLRSFDVGPKNNIKHNITFCTECLSELFKQTVLYQPGEEE